MFDFQGMKSGLFAELGSVDDAVDYASQLAGPAGVTAAMVLYNTVMQKLDEEQQKRQAEQIDQIDKLCTAYQAYQEALKNENSNGIRVWGKMLIEAQEALGYDFYNADLIKRIIEDNDD